MILPAIQTAIRSALATLVTIVATVVLAGCSASADTNEAVEGLMQADRSRAKAQLSMKVDEIEAHYADDAVVYHPGSPAAVGKVAVLQLLSGLRSTSDFRMAEQPIGVTVSMSGDLGYTTGDFIVSKRVETSKGKMKRVEHHGNYVAVWRSRDGGGWECIAHTANYRPDWAS